MDYKDFIKKYKKSDNKIYLFYGSEPLLINWAVKEITNLNIAPGFEAVDYVKLDGRNLDVDVFINSCETIPLMSKNRVIIIDGMSALDGGKGKKLSETEDVHTRK